MVSYKLIDLWEMENKFLNVLNLLGQRGLRVDLDKAKSMAELSAVRMDDIRQRLGFNPGSKLDLEKALLIDLGLPVVLKTKNGNPSFNKTAMADYDIMLSAMGNPLAQDILAYRGWQQANSFYYTGYQNMVSPDGRIRPNYKPTGTRTGRLSCELPNLQQIPRMGQKEWSRPIKGLFIPTSDEWVLWDFDYASLEFRIALFYAGEADLIERVNSGADFHQVTADLIKEKTGVEVTRYDAKQMNFAIVYGAGAEKLAYMLKATRDASTGKATDTQVMGLIQAHREAFPGFHRVSKAVGAKARKKGAVRYWSGRRRRFDTIWNHWATKDAWNSICQGGGAEIVKHAMVRLHETVDDPEHCRMVLQVHDSVAFEIRRSRLDEFRDKIRSSMECNPQFPVKFHVEDKQWAT